MGRRSSGMPFSSAASRSSSSSVWLIAWHLYGKGWVVNDVLIDRRQGIGYATASRGFYERVKVRAPNKVDEWGPSDHCHLLIEVETG